MRTTADLNRIIDKLAENNPARFDAPAPNRDEVSRSPERRSSETPRVEKRKKIDDAKTDSQPFAPRLADDSGSLATPSTRSARTRRRSPDGSIPRRLDSLRAPDGRVKNEKNGKFAESDAEKNDSKESDEEIKRTQRRRQIDPTTCERDYSTDEIEFMKALDDYKRTSGRMFPTCSEILEVFKSLGYVKTARAEPTDDSPKRNAQQRRVATPAFLSDEESDAFSFDDALVPGVA
jgi:hypothetical protein